MLGFRVGGHIACISPYKFQAKRSKQNHLSLCVQCFGNAKQIALLDLNACWKICSVETP